MSANAPVATVVIPTFNGQRYLEEVLSSLFQQKTDFPYEVVIIDSGSTDASLDIINSFPVILHQIPNSEFNHGETRNLGAQLAKGQFVAYLTHDATPANDLGRAPSGRDRLSRTPRLARRLLARCARQSGLR